MADRQGGDGGRRSRGTWRWVGVAAVAAMIFAGSALPERSIHQVVDPLVRVVRPDAETPLLAPWRRRAKNAAHLLEYALLAVVLARAIRPHARRRGTALFLALGLTAAYAGTDELHQTLNPGRTARLSDWALDVAGASAGLASLVLCERLTGRAGGSPVAPSIRGLGTAAPARRRTEAPARRWPSGSS